MPAPLEHDVAVVSILDGQQVGHDRVGREGAHEVMLRGAGMEMSDRPTAASPRIFHKLPEKHVSKMIRNPCEYPNIREHYWYDTI